MKIARTVARVFLALIFIAAGASGFGLYFHLIPMPPSPPSNLASVFQQVFFESGWVLYVDILELIAGVLLILNRYVPLALIMLSGVVYNILVFHLTMGREGLLAPVVLIALIAFVAWPLRERFAALFVSE